MAINRDGDGPPLRREDAKPPAGDDLRAAPFTDHVFDDDYYGRSGKSGGGRPYGLVLGIVLGTSVAVGVGYFAFRTPGGPSVPGGEPPVIRADSSPYKAKPEDPGGMQVANQDKLVYERVAKGDAPQQVENLLPPAEEPKEPPPKPVEKSVAKEQPAMEKVASVPNSISADSEIDPLEKAVAEIAGERTQPVDLRPKTPSPPAQNAAETVPPPQQTAAVRIPDGSYLVQLAAARSNEGAEGEWNRLSNQNEELLGGLSHVVLQADLGERGVFYRLRVGPLSDRNTAEDLCAALAAKNVGCIVVRP
jgi:hypothetical protein